MLVADLASLWGKAVVRFLNLLRDSLHDSLLMVISTSAEYPLIYDSNVLVVVEDDCIDVVKRVLRVKREVEREFNDEVSINPLIATRREERIINAFKNLLFEQIPSKDVWRRAIMRFTERLHAEKLAVQVLALAPNEQLYDSNVLVVVEDDCIDVVKRVLRVKREVEREFNDEVSINPLIATRREERIINAFKSRDTIE
jgi:predicted secreted protein